MGLMTAGGSFRLQKGEGVGMGEGVYVRPLNVVLYSSNLFQGILPFLERLQSIQYKPDIIN